MASKPLLLTICLVADLETARPSSLSASAIFTLCEMLPLLSFLKMNNDYSDLKIICLNSAVMQNPDDAAVVKAVENISSDTDKNIMRIKDKKVSKPLKPPAIIVDHVASVNPWGSRTGKFFVHLVVGVVKLHILQTNRTRKLLTNSQSFKLNLRFANQIHPPYNKSSPTETEIRVFESNSNQTSTHKSKTNRIKTQRRYLY